MEVGVQLWHNSEQLFVGFDIFLCRYFCLTIWYFVIVFYLVFMSQIVICLQSTLALSFYKYVVLTLSTLICNKSLSENKSPKTSIARGKYSTGIVALGNKKWHGKKLCPVAWWSTYNSPILSSFWCIVSLIYEEQKSEGVTKKWRCRLDIYSLNEAKSKANKYQDQTGHNIYVQLSHAIVPSMCCLPVITVTPDAINKYDTISIEVPGSIMGIDYSSCDTITLSALN